MSDNSAREARYAEAIVAIAGAAGVHDLPAMTGPQILDLAEQTRDYVAALEVDSAGLRSACRALAEVGAPETMAPTEAIHYLATRPAPAVVLGEAGTGEAFDAHGCVQVVFAHQSTVDAFDQWLNGRGMQRFQIPVKDDLPTYGLSLFRPAPVVAPSAEGGAPMNTWTPATLEAIFDQIADLIIEWHEADRWADNAPASERDDARGLAEERKDIVLQYLAQVMTP